MSHPVRLCPHCRTVAPSVGAVCRLCWQYRYRHGTLPDTAALAARARGAYGTCVTCGGPTLPRRRAQGRCDACRAYRWRVGEDRPARLWREAGAPRRATPACINCGARRQRYRRCEACRSYWAKYHVERPRQLWGPPPRVLECWCGVPVFAAVPRRGLCELHYRQDLARRKAAGVPLQGWGA